MAGSQDVAAARAQRSHAVDDRRMHLFRVPKGRVRWVQTPPWKASLSAENRASAAPAPCPLRPPMDGIQDIDAQADQFGMTGRMAPQLWGHELEPAGRGRRRSCA